MDRNSIRIFDLYKRTPRGFLYVPLRWLITPIREINSYLPEKGRIIELGCGEGVIATYIALSSTGRKVIGVDINAQKINLAQKATQGVKNLKFEKGDALKKVIAADAFVLSDFLHHLTREKQNVLLIKIFKYLNKNGVLIIKEIDLNDWLRAKISRIFDFIFYPKDEIFFSSSKDQCKSLKNLGFTITIKKEKKLFPGSTTVYICSKK